MAGWNGPSRYMVPNAKAVANTQRARIRHLYQTSNGPMIVGTRMDASAEVNASQYHL